MTTPSYLRASQPPFPWRSVLLAALALILLVGGFLFVRRASYLREVAAERAQVNEYGVPALMGPVSPGGPLYGDGGQADLAVTDNGWNKVHNPDGSVTSTVYVTVRNKSGRTWEHVQAVVGLFGDEGDLGTQRADVGTLAPGADGTANLTPEAAGVRGFQVLGVDGR